MFASMNDYIAFKFRAVNKDLIESLVSSTLYFAPRKQLNDPFDSSIDIARAINSAKKHATGANLQSLQLLTSESFISKYEKALDMIGICSFSLSIKDTLMWSHYADNHAGVAPRYKFSEEYLDDERHMLGVARAIYEPNRISSWLQTNAYMWITNDDEFVMGLLKELLVSKAPAWKYENESRFMRMTIGPFEIPRSSLKSVVFGLRTSPDDQNLVRSIVSIYYEHVLFEHTIRTNDDFGIDFEEI